MDQRRVSKLMSKILRHQPELANLTLKDGGWVGVDDLLGGLAALGHPISRDQLNEIVRTNDKKRFSLSDDFMSIRAAQGHSTAVEMNYERSAPPPILFHGTSEANLPKILEQGLLPRNRQFVHLSLDEETAVKVGRRHGRPVLLDVDTATMTDAGHDFYCADNGVWLAASVPPQFLKVRESEAKKH